MKNKFRILALIQIVTMLVGCADNTNENSDVSLAIQEGIEKSEGIESSVPQIGDIIEIGDNAQLKDFESIEEISTDINILEMTKTLAYSQVILMMSQPQDYWGKTVKVSGMYAKQSMEGFPDLHFLLLLDETNCCQGFLELSMPDDVIYPDNGEYMAVAGTYEFISDDTGEYSAIQVSEYAV